MSGTWLAPPSRFSPAVIVNGAPEVQLAMPPNCQLSTSRDTHPGDLFNNARPGPNGNSNVPFVRMSCDRSAPSRLLFNCRLRGSMLPAVPSDRLHVKVVWLVKPWESRFVTAACIE